MVKSHSFLLYSYDYDDDDDDDGDEKEEKIERLEFQHKSQKVLYSEGPSILLDFWQENYISLFPFILSWFLLIWVREND